jgi:hypothetical protein
LEGCVATQAHRMPQRPAAPVITALSHEGMVCYSEQDAYQLYLYILELEDGYSEP